MVYGLVVLLAMTALVLAAVSSSSFLTVAGVYQGF